ncbi:M23 family metallopeptidase [Salibacterium halotolerans]|uniref:Peptidase family M23 n=1 Tax=Salibacterium halotolerans TaxID=1884432 RepID=A0A1I5PHV2_9BACI|nr:M23 family metallopeptidase [Salibacterium halotolerans]SFP33702.1 Peptidase family M23 [Salibacterium halotolerans]
MTGTIIQLFIIQLLLPALFIISLWRAKMTSKLEWIIQGLFTTTFISWIFLSSPWYWSSYYLRFVWLLLLVLALFFSWKKIRTMPFRAAYSRSQKGSLVVYVLLLIIFGMYHIGIINGYSAEEEAVELAFPLQNGTYYVSHGGADTQINYHNAHPAQEFAVDVVALNTLGSRAAGLYPENLDKYTIYGKELHSPCSGEVTASRSTLPDLTPPETNADQPRGNFVEVQCDGQNVQVLLAHMQEGSVQVEEGDTVEEGDPIGVIGNSGNTSEPHLHMHAERNGEGVPMTFNGRFLVRNDIVWLR